MIYTTQYSIRDICEILDIEVPEEHKDIADEKLTNMAYNTKFLSKGGAYFLAAKNMEERENCLNKAIEEGVRIIFCGPLTKELPAIETIRHIVIANPFEAVIKVSASIRDKLGLNVIGITGSLGKTTTKDIVCAVLKQKFVTQKSLGNQNTIFPIFDNLQKMDVDTTVYIQEFGAATPGVMPKTERACLPNAGIITNISDPHLDVFGTKENILKEKLNLITQMAEGCPAFLNYDDVLLKEVKLEKHPIISYAVNNKEADYYAENLEVFSEYMTFDIVHKDMRTPVRLNALGGHNVANALVAAAVGEYFGMTQEEIIKGVAAYKSQGIRQNLTNIGGYNLIIDCYNNAPISLRGAVDVLGKFPVQEGGKRIAIMGDIQRLGERERAIHIETGEKIGELGNFDIGICFGGENAKIMAEAMRKKGKAVLYTGDREELNEWMRCLITKKDITLVKAGVVRLLSRSIDQVFGTSYHVNSENFEWLTRGDYRFKLIYEKEDHHKKTMALTAYYGNETALTLPNQCDGIGVFCVAAKSFEENMDLKEINIPAPIYNISASAFKSCAKLQKVTLPATLKVIGASAFDGCESLSDVIIPEGVIDIGMRAFANCKELQTVFIPETVGHIGSKAFSKCKQLVIKCLRDSYAHQYAVENKIAVEVF